MLTLWAGVFIAAVGGGMIGYWVGSLAERQHGK